MHMMLELPTIKINFLFKNSQNFNQTTHSRPQYTIVFIHNISLYFKCISSVKYVFKLSCHSHIMPFSAVWPKRFNAFTPKNCLHLVWKVEKMFTCSFKTSFFTLFTFQIGDLRPRFWSQFGKILFVSILYVISFSNFFETTLRPNWL